MTLAGRITFGASVLIAAGLVALAAPTVVNAASWASERLVAAPTADVEAELGADADTEALPSDLPEGYVSVGEGTYIPAGGPGDCEGSSWINVVGTDGVWRASLGGDELVDMGPRQFAAGKVGYAADGRIATYTLEPGDAP